jgi:hypothetical protein
MTYTEAHKRATYKWNEKNRERHLELARVAEKRLYQKHRDQRKIKALERYYYFREMASFRNILISEISM